MVYFYNSIRVLWESFKKGSKCCEREEISIGFSSDFCKILVYEIEE